MKGRDAHRQRLKRLSGPDVVKAAGGVLHVGADMIRSYADHSIVAGSVSRDYHVPSNPGQPPNNDTDTLRNGIKNRMVAPLEAQVTSEAPYAAALEWGTSRMEARPYMRPARDKKAPEIQRLFEVEIDKLVKGSGT